MADDDSQRGVDRNPERADPTPLTTAALLREVGHIRIELASAVDNIATRLNAMDQAVKLFKDDLVRVPTDTDKQIGGLRDVLAERFKTFEEKFNGVGKQFQLNEIALNAALSAAKEAVGKQNESSTLATAKAEASSTKLMDQMRDIVNTNNGGLNDKIDDGRNRMTQLEARLVGLLQDVAQLRALPPAPTERSSSTAVVFYIMGALGLAMLIVIIIFEVLQRGAIR